MSLTTFLGRCLQQWCENTTVDDEKFEVWFAFNEERLKKKFGDASEDVKVTVLSRDFFKFKPRSKMASFSFNTKIVELKLNEDIYMSAYEKLQHQNTK